MNRFIPEVSNKLAIICILIVFLLPELVIWGTVDSFKEPLRAYRGDTAHYMTVLNNALVSGGPEGNSFLYEEQEHGSRFFVFESLVGLVGKILPISAPILGVILQVLVPLLAFYLFYSTLAALGIERRLSSFVSLINTLVYGVIAYDGYGLSFWFVPFLLLGIWILVFSSTNDIFTPKIGIMMALSTILFTLHPAYFAFGTVLAAAAWFVLILKYKLRTVLPYFVFWGVLAVALFLTLFADLLIPSAVGNDLLERMAIIRTRFPIHPIQLIELLLLGLAVFSYRKFDVISAAFFIGFLALFVPTITGVYLVNDHYVIAKDYLITVAALLLIYSEDMRRRVWLGFALLITTLADFIAVIQYFDFRFGYYGRYAVLHTALLIISFILISPNFKIFIRKLVALKSLRIIFIILAILYSLFLQYKDYTNAHLTRDRNIQQYRPLFEHLENLPNGVVMADNFLSFHIPIFTAQKIYWSSLASNHPAPTLNILQRFEDAHLFFPDDPAHKLPEIADYIFGAINKCTEFNRRGILEKLASLGFQAPLIEMCAPAEERQVSYNAIKDEVENRRDRILTNKKWQPAYRVDYLVVREQDKQVPKWLIEKYFTEINQVSGVKIYRYHNQ